MKKIFYTIFLFLLLIFISNCSSPKTNKLNPPSIMIGEWESDNCISTISTSQFYFTTYLNTINSDFYDVTLEINDFPYYTIKLDDKLITLILITDTLSIEFDNKKYYLNKK